MMCYSIIIYVLLLFVNKLSEKVQKKNFMCTAAFAPKKIVFISKILTLFDSNDFPWKA